MAFIRSELNCKQALKLALLGTSALLLSLSQLGCTEEFKTDSSTKIQEVSCQETAQYKRKFSYNSEKFGMIYSCTATDEDGSHTFLRVGGKSVSIGECLNGYCYELGENNELKIYAQDEGNKPIEEVNPN